MAEIRRIRRSRGPDDWEEEEYPPGRPPPPEGAVAAFKAARAACPPITRASCRPDQEEPDPVVDRIFNDLHSAWGRRKRRFEKECWERLVSHLLQLAPPG
jgi:hypothetical protein